MLGVPDHVRREQGEGNQQPPRCHGRLCSASRASSQKTAWHADAEHDIDHRLLGEEAEPDGDAEQDGEATCSAASPASPRPRAQLSRHSDQRHVGGDQQRRIRDPRQRGEHDGRPEADPGDVQRPPDEEDDEGGERVEDRRGRADAGLAVAADRRWRRGSPRRSSAAWRNSRRRARATKSNTAPRRARDRSWRNRSPRSAEPRARRDRARRRNE